MTPLLTMKNQCYGGPLEVVYFKHAKTSFTVEKKLTLVGTAKL